MASLREILREALDFQQRRGATSCSRWLYRGTCDSVKRREFLRHLQQHGSNCATAANFFRWMSRSTLSTVPRPICLRWVQPPLKYNLRSILRNDNGGQMIALHFCLPLDDARGPAADLPDTKQARRAWGKRSQARVDLLLKRSQSGLHSLH